MTWIVETDLFPYLRVGEVTLTCFFFCYCLYTYSRSTITTLSHSHHPNERYTAAASELEKLKLRTGNERERETMKKLIDDDDNDDMIDDEDKVTDISSGSKGMLGWLGPPFMINILVAELCERYSFYALRSILVLFFSGPLGWSDSASVSVVFFSASLSYFTPLLGGWIADAKLGKYKTILRFCMIYIIGSSILTISAAAESAFIAITGLIAIAIGTGGIKPVVSAFGRDQLEHESEVVKERFFRVFYFCINVGSVVSFIFSPLLKKYVGYPVAFGVPTLFLGVATYTFWSARDSYSKQAPTGSPWSTVIRTLRAARKNNNNKSNNTTRHWIHDARGIDGCSASDIYETLAVYRVGVVLAIFPIYWTLYDQQGSAWTLQAERMNLYGTCEFITKLKKYHYHHHHNHNHRSRTRTARSCKSNHGLGTHSNF